MFLAGVLQLGFHLFALELLLLQLVGHGEHLFAVVLAARVQRSHVLRRRCQQQVATLMTANGRIAAAAGQNLFTRDGTRSHFVTQRPSDAGIQRPGDPVDPVTLFYNEL